MVNEIDSTSLKQRLEAGDDFLLVDIRTPAEIAQGVIPDSIPLAMHLLPLRLDELPRERDLVLYCRSGARSYQACSFLMQQGWNRVLNLRGGIIEWARNGFNIALPSL